jgi:hypothetical protein
MNATKLINIQRDEYGYSIYWGAHTRLEPGSGRLREVRRRRVEIIVLADLMTYLAEREIVIESGEARTLTLAAAIRTAGAYHGRKISNRRLIADTVKDWLRSGLVRGFEKGCIV